MASPTLSEVRAALAAALANVAGIKKVHEFVPDSISDSPCAEVQPAPGDFLVYSEAFGDIAGYLFYITVYAPGADAIAAQKLLDPLLAASGIRASVNGTLGGVVADAEISLARNYRSETIDSIRYVVCDLPVKVMC